MAAKKAAPAVNDAASDAQDSDGGIYLDPDLAKLRDVEAARLESVVVTERAEPSIDPTAEKAREADLARLNDDGTVRVVAHTIQ